MIALPARQHAIAQGLPAFQKILPRQLYRRLRSLRAAGSKVYASTVAEIVRSNREHARRQLLCLFGMELRRMCKRDTTGLLGHRASDFWHSVTDVHYRCLSGGIQIAPAFRIDNPATFAAYRDRITFSKIA